MRYFSSHFKQFKEFDRTLFHVAGICMTDFHDDNKYQSCDICILVANTEICKLGYMETRVIEKIIIVVLDTFVNL